jgi:hypothetical protein
MIVPAFFEQMKGRRAGDNATTQPLRLMEREPFVLIDAVEYVNRTRQTRAYGKEAFGFLNNYSAVALGI